MKMVKQLLGVVAIALVPSMVSAQASDAALTALRNNWKGMVVNITKAAEEVAEKDYGFKPVATVRSFGEVVAHVAGTQDMICAGVLGEKPPAEDAIEKVAKTKAAIVAALKASTAHCEKAYAIASTTLQTPMDLFGEKNTRAGALTLNAVHDGEHYGNIVTYMRMKGMIPPSSQPAKK